MELWQGLTASVGRLRYLRQAEKLKLVDLARLEDILVATIAQCSGDPAPSCPELDMLEGQELA